MSESEEELVTGELVPIDEEVSPEEPGQDVEVFDEPVFERPRTGRTQKFSPNDAYLHLSTVKAMGHIFDFKRLPRRVENRKAQPVKFLIETVPTRHAHYNNPEARGKIVLTTREVMAFVEGIYAATRLTPESDDNRFIASRVVEGERWHPTHRAGDFYR